MNALAPSLHRRPGRPKKIITDEKDYGTPELIFKRAHGHTEEALDLCLAKDLITQEQHWCGIHLRWLYTLRYGAPGVRSVDPAHVDGIDIDEDDPTWREQREAEYNDALKQLGGGEIINHLSNICIHNERPVFLTRPRGNPDENNRSLEILRTGLDILAKHWRR